MSLLALSLSTSAAGELNPPLRLRRLTTHLNPKSDVNKVKPFLDALEASHKPVKYYALDLSELALKRNLEKLQAACYKHVACNGLWGTFDDVRKWATDVSEPIWYMSLGSIFGNDEFDVAVRDLRTWSNAMRPQDYMLLGVDGCPDKERIWKSLNTPIPGMPNLVEHGLALSNTILGHTWYRPEEWEVFGVCEQLGPVCTHQWVIRALKDTACDALGFHASKGDEIYTVKWFRWGPDGMKKQFDHSDFEQVASWKSPTGPVCKYPSSSTSSTANIRNEDQYLVRPAKMAN